jgi:predicted RecB family nuclease
LKKIAPLANFEWQVDDPGGGMSMLYYDMAVRDGDATEQDKARKWLLTYNQGDVEATLAIRNWIEREGESIPSIEVLDAKFTDVGHA